MGAAFLIVLNQPVEFSTAVNGQALARAEEVLDDIAVQLGVKPLMDFYSTDPHSVPQEVRNLVAAWTEEWFGADEGLKTIRALLTHLESNDLDSFNTESVVVDLKQFEQVLSQAETQNVEWHLEVDY